MNPTRVSQIGILLLAFFLRVLNLDGRALWYDEAFAILYAEKTFARMWYGTVSQVQGAAADVHPLFFYALLHEWMNVVGESAFAVRFFSAVLSVASAAIVIRLARELFDRTHIALGAGLVVAVAPFAVAYGQEARMYALLGFSGALLILAYVMLERNHLLKQGEVARSAQDDRISLAKLKAVGPRLWWIVFILSGAAMLYSHNLAVFFGAALAVWILALAIASRNFKSLRSFSLAGVAIVLLWFPWLTLLPSQFGKIQQAYWIGAPDAVTLLQTLLTFTVDFDNARLPPLLLPFALIGALMIVLLLIFEIARSGWREARIRMLALLAGLPPLLIFVVSLWRPVYLTRALMPSFLMLAIMVAWLLTRLPKLFAWSLVLYLVVLIVAVFSFYYTYQDFPRPPFRDAVNFLESEIQTNDVILHDNKLSYFPMYYYARGHLLPQKFIEDPKGGGSDTLALPTQEALGLYAESLNNAVGQNARVWFVIFSEAGAESPQVNNLEWMKTRYRLQREWTFHDLEIYLFEK